MWAAIRAARHHRRPLRRPRHRWRRFPPAQPGPPHRLRRMGLLFEGLPLRSTLGSTDGTLVLPRVASRRRADMSFVTDETDGTAVARLEVVKANQSIQLITISLTEASTI